MWTVWFGYRAKFKWRYVVPGPGCCACLMILKSKVRSRALLKHRVYKCKRWAFNGLLLPTLSLILVGEDTLRMKDINSQVARYFTAAMLDEDHKASSLASLVKSSNMAVMAFVLFFSVDSWSTQKYHNISNQTISMIKQTKNYLNYIRSVSYVELNICIIKSDFIQL